MTVSQLRGRGMACSLLSVFSLLSLVPARAVAQAPADVAIVATARDYIDGFFAGDSIRVRRSLHPDVAKRLVSGEDRPPSNQTADMLVQMTGRRRSAGSADPVPADSITIVHREADMALVRIGAPRWVDHLHIARFGDRWQIVNVMWQLRPRG